MKRVLQEPLLHFVLLGVAVFAVDAFLRDRTAGEGGEIVVSEGRIENLAALFVKTWQRPPTAEELRGLVDDYVLEEALYREGVAMGVDKDDTVIRRRVRQKMEFVVEDVVEVTEPPETEFEAWLAEHPESYERPARFTFRQVYLSPDRRGDTVRAEAERVLVELRTATDAVDPRELGDSSLLDYAYEDTGADMVARSFGQAFADQLAERPAGEWSGPVESAFGLHLVFVDAKTEGRLPALAEVREAVVRDWSYAQREEASKRFYDEVLKRYRVTIEWPKDVFAAQGMEPNQGQER
jgi:hypothetical protein